MAPSFGAGNDAEIRIDENCAKKISEERMIQYNLHFGFAGFDEDNEDRDDSVDCGA
jgi:hypothetical protein